MKYTFIKSALNPRHIISIDANNNIKGNSSFGVVAAGNKRNSLPGDMGRAALSVDPTVIVYGSESEALDRFFNKQVNDAF